MSEKTTAAIFWFYLIIFFQVSPVWSADLENPTLNEPAMASPSIRLDVNQQKLSGIQTLTLEPSSYQVEFTAYGNALNIQPLLDLQHRYQLTLTDLSSAKAKLLHSKQSVSRQQSLFHHGISSKKNLQIQQLQWQIDNASTHGTQVQSKIIMDELSLMWGKELTEWALSGKANHLDDFVNGQQTLLKIYLPVTKHLATDIQTIAVEPSGDRNRAGIASLIAMAPHNDHTMQGESYFFKTNDHAIKPGMRVAAWIPEQNNQLTGVIIPKSALLWHMDQSFVYIKTNPESFIRRKIDNYSESPNGYFIKNELKPGEQIVITGNQLLLSEEFRVQIPREDND